MSLLPPSYTGIGGNIESILFRDLLIKHMEKIFVAYCHNSFPKKLNQLKCTKGSHSRRHLIQKLYNEIASFRGLCLLLHVINYSFVFFGGNIIAINTSLSFENFRLRMLTLHNKLREKQFSLIPHNITENWEGSKSFFLPKVSLCFPIIFTTSLQNPSSILFS